MSDSRKQPRAPEVLIELLKADEVVTVTNEEREALYDYMEDNGIDPDDYRQSGNDVWSA